MPDFSLIHRTQPASVGGAPHPALILLHGLGSHELDLMSIAPLIDPRLYVISARAPFEYGWGGYMWYDLEEGPGLGNEKIEASLDMLRRFVDEVAQAYPVDRRHIYLGGFSQGAAMAGALGLLEPEQVAGVVMASGYLPPDDSGRYEYRVQQAAGHPFFQANGTLDQVVNITYGRMTRDFLAQTPVDLTYREYAMGHEVIPGEIRDLSSWLEKVLGAPQATTQSAS